MFDFSFGEIFVIAVVAVIFLGPDKLPQTFVKIAKFLRAIKKTINDAKDTLDREIHITEMKQDALEYKKKFADSAEKLKNEILKDADVDGIKREIEGAKSAAILNEPLEKRSISFDEVESKGKAVQERLKGNLKKKNASGNSSLGTPCGDLADFGHCADSSLALRPKSAKNSTTSTAIRRICERSEAINTRIYDLDSANQVKNAESALDSANPQNLDKNNSVRSTQTRPLRGAKNREQGRSSASADFLLEAEKRGSPPKSEKAELFGAQGERGEGCSPFCEKESKLSGENSGKVAESSVDSADSQNLGENQAKIAESTKKSKKSTLDSANKKPKKSPRNTTKNRRTKQDGSN